MAQGATFWSLKSTECPNGRVCVGDLVKHRNHPETSRVSQIMRHGDGSKRIYLEDGRRIDPLYCLKV